MRFHFRPLVPLLMLTAVLLFTTGCGVQIHYIPLHVIALEDDDGGRSATNRIDPEDFENVMSDLNLLYLPAGIQFTFDQNSDWEVRRDTALNNMQNGSGSGSAWAEGPNAAAARYPGKIVIFLRRGPDGGASNGFAYPPNTGQSIPSSMPLPADNIDFVALPTNGSPPSVGFLAHEIGHYLGLFHTHPDWGGSVAAIQDEIDTLGPGGLDGDGLSDTAPDGAPNHYVANSSSSSACGGTGVYFAFAPDILNVPFQVAPDRSNIMGYFRCNNLNFSLQQLVILRETLEHDFRRHLIEPVCYPDHHRLPGDEFQRCVDYWRLKGRWPVSVSTTELDEVYMTSSIQPGAPRYVRDRIDADRFQDTFDAAADNGDRPEQVQGVMIDGEPRWNGVWTDAVGPFSSGIGRTQAFFADSWSDMTDQGFQLVDFNVNEDWENPQSNARRFNYTWEDQGEMDFIAHYDMTAADYVALFNTYDEDGYEVVRFNTYWTAQGKRYAALWHPQEMDYAHIPWQTPETYQANYQAYAAAGFRLRQLHDFDGLISAIWIREPTQGGGGISGFAAGRNPDSTSSEPGYSAGPRESGGGTRSIATQRFGEVRLDASR